MTALRRLLLLLIAAGVAGVWLRRRVEPPSPGLPASGPGPLEIETALDPPPDASAPSRLEMGPVTDEMNAIPLPIEEELALLDAAEPEAAVTEDEPNSEPDGEPADEQPEDEPADEELARVEAAEPDVRRMDRAAKDAGDADEVPESVDIVSVVDDLLEPPR